MELRQLEYFTAVADEASFTRAAARLHVAQPGVSAQVRRLERELGQPLLDRTGRTVTLTDAGAAVLPYARAALEAAAGARRAAAETSDLVRGRVSVGIVGSLSSLDLPEMLAGFHAAHPGVEVTLTEDRPDRLLAAVRAGRLDLALVGAAAPPGPGVAMRVVADEPLVAAVGPGDPLAGRASVTLRALADRPLITLPVGSGVRTCLDDACAAAGLRPRIAFEAGDPVVLARLAVRGLGVAVLPGPAAAAGPPGLRTVAITRPRMRGRVLLVWRSRGPVGPAARALAAYARRALAPG
ncbi:MAG TPA: LysR family transcriptional regulator [Streptosporangiaceae bacterium]|jgi:DNA-binding transcriptional LysR family regulator